MTRGTFSLSVSDGDGGACVGGRRKVGVVAVGGMVVIAAAAAAVEGRSSVVGGSRWLDWEVVESRGDSGHKAVAVVAASHANNVSFVYV